MPLERVIYHPLQNAMTGVFFPSVGGGASVPANARYLEDATVRNLEDATPRTTEA